MELIDTEHIDDLSLEDIREKIKAGSRFVVFGCTISLIFSSIRKVSPVFLLEPGDKAVKYSFPYLLISILFGWWSLRGFAYTLKDIREAFSGKDITREVLYSRENNTALEIKQINWR